MNQTRRAPMGRAAALALGLALIASTGAGETKQFATAPPIASGPLSAEVAEAVDTVFGEKLRSGFGQPEQIEALWRLGHSGDVRLAWMISDLMRFVGSPNLSALLSEVARALMGMEEGVPLEWGTMTDHLMAWDVPAPPGYLDAKRRIFTLVLPEWERIFVPGDVDWRYVSWGGGAD